jgi:hypothetical protein
MGSPVSSWLIMMVNRRKRGDEDDEGRGQGPPHPELPAQGQIQGLGKFLKLLTFSLTSPIFLTSLTVFLTSLTAKNLGIPKATIKTAAEFRRIARRMPLAHPMMKCRKSCLSHWQSGYAPRGAASGPGSGRLGPRTGPAAARPDTGA